jgi:hypothetical protein
MVFVIVVVFTVVGFHAVLAQNQGRLDGLRARLAVAEARYDDWRLETGRLASPARITARATEIGMIVPPMAPIAVAVPGELPRHAADSSVLAGYAEVKRHLEPTP